MQLHALVGALLDLCLVRRYARGGPRAEGIPSVSAHTLRLSNKRCASWTRALGTSSATFGLVPTVLSG
eukprot:2979052-Alexandrium_andersonii.AAC.1